VEALFKVARALACVVPALAVCATGSFGSGSVGVAPAPVSGTTTAGSPDRALAAPRVARLIIAGDIAGCDWDADRKTARLVQRMSGVVMTAGDNVYPSGTYRQYQRCYDPTWGRFLNRTRPVVGNHDRLSRNGRGYFRYFGRRAGPRGRGYYAFSVGSWRVYALDSNCDAVGGCGKGSRQYRWLKAQLAANRSQCVLAVWHHPLLSSGQHGGSGATRGLMRLLYRAGAELVISGHDHSYERFARIRPDGRLDRAHGIRLFIVGTGGAPHYGFGRRLVPASRVRSASSYGVLRLALGHRRYAWKFVPVPGHRFRDAGTGVCHGRPG